VKEIAKEEAEATVAPLRTLVQDSHKWFEEKLGKVRNQKKIRIFKIL
jgi:hypothetical protein